MLVWSLSLFLFITQCFVLQVYSYSTTYHHSNSGRKLFGGYRIVPKSCISTLEAKEMKPKTGICMFNYECVQRGGDMIGSCVDGFLFGVCCAVSDTQQLTNSGNDATQTIEEVPNSLHSSEVVPSGTPATTHKTSRGPDVTLYQKTSNGYVSNTFNPSTNTETDTGTPSNLPSSDLKETTIGILEQYLNNENTGGFIDNQAFLSINKYPISDTILLNYDGSEVHEEYDPEKIFTIPARRPTTPIPPTTDNTRPELVTFTYVTNADGQVLASTNLDKFYNEKFEQTTPKTEDILNTIQKLSTIIDEKITTDKLTSKNEERRTTKKPDEDRKTTKTTVDDRVTTRNPVEDRKTTKNPVEDRKTTKTPVEDRKTTKNPVEDRVTTKKTVDRVTTKIPVEDRKTTKTPDIYNEERRTTIDDTVKTSYTSLDDEKLILVPTFTNKNDSKSKTPSSKFTVKPTTVSKLDVDLKYPGYNYESYNGISNPPLLISSPAGLDDGAQAISHIIGLLNNTEPEPEPEPIRIEHVTPPMDSPGFSTWVSIVGNDKKVTKKPLLDDEVLPTVIVISPPTTEKKKITTKRPVIITKPTYVSKPGFYLTKAPVTSEEEQLISFPPVRNPDLNATGINQVEKPTLVETHGSAPGIITNLELLPGGPEVNTIDPDEDYDDFTTPQLQDEKMETKVHSFVEKIVNSLAGNFQDLETVLFTNENKTKITNTNGIELNNINIGESATKKPTTPTPTKKPITTKKPLRKTTQKPETTLETTTITTTKKPKPTTTTTTKRPTTTTTKKTTRKPTTTTTTTSTTTTTTTKRPTTTKKPVTIKTTTTKKPTTTTTTVEYDEVTETVGETDVTTVSAPTTVEDVTVDYRRECGVRPLVKKGGRIVGGKGSTFGSYPWQVLVRESTWLGLFTKNKCGGVLITNKFVITAAHCQPGFLASLVAVFGEFDISGELESKRSIAKNVRRVIVHRQYDPATFENDLALLELDSPVNYDEHIVPICMPKEGEDFTGRMATVTGWGRLKYGGGVPSVLQEVRVPLIENSVCQEMFQTAGHQKRIISSFLCAGYANGQKDSCEGDSGGPLMVEREDGHWVLIGTVSHGIKCAAPYLPGVYMRTTYYKPWLRTVTGVNT